MRQYAIDDIRQASYPRTLYNISTADTNVEIGSFPSGTQVAAGVIGGNVQTGNSAADSFKPVDGTDYMANPNDLSAAMWHLLRESDLVPEVFLCPSSSATAVQLGAGAGKESYVNFANPIENCSYSFHNMYYGAGAVTRGAIWTDSLGSTFPMASDMNPGVTEIGGGEFRDNVAVVTTDSSSKQMKLGNSNNHNKEGQSVLFGGRQRPLRDDPLRGPQPRQHLHQAGHRRDRRGRQRHRGSVRPLPRLQQQRLPLPQLQPLGRWRQLPAPHGRCRPRQRAPAVAATAKSAEATAALITPTPARLAPGGRSRWAVGACHANDAESRLGIRRRLLIDI